MCYHAGTNRPADTDPYRPAHHRANVAAHALAHQPADRLADHPADGRAHHPADDRADTGKEGHMQYMSQQARSHTLIRVRLPKEQLPYDYDEFVDHVSLSGAYGAPDERADAGTDARADDRPDPRADPRADRRAHAHADTHADRGADQVGTRKRLVFFLPVAVTARCDANEDRSGMAD